MCSSGEWLTTDSYSALLLDCKTAEGMGTITMTDHQAAHCLSDMVLVYGYFTSQLSSAEGFSNSCSLPRLINVDCA